MAQAFSMSSPIHHLSAGLVIALALWAGCADGLQGAQNLRSVGTLRELTVDGTSDRIVVTLIADRPLDGVLERIETSPTRVFVDLKNVVPEVDRVTNVDRGSVTRVRVGLNQADPPVTRVVIDLEGSTSSFLEQGRDRARAAYHGRGGIVGDVDPHAARSGWPNRSVRGVVRKNDSHDVEAACPRRADAAGRGERARPARPARPRMEHGAWGA